jgi:hypothetical protein
MVIIPWSLSIIQTRYLRRCRRRTHRRLASGFVQYREWAASNLDPDDPTIKVRLLGIRFAVPVHQSAQNLPVQPGCTNLGLSALLYSRTNANDDGRIPCGQIPAETGYKSSTAGVYSHPDTRRTYGEYQALVAIFCDWKDAVETGRTGERNSCLHLPALIRAAMIHATITGLEKDEPAHERNEPGRRDRDRRSS